MTIPVGTVYQADFIYHIADEQSYNMQRARAIIRMAKIACVHEQDIVNNLVEYTLLSCNASVFSCNSDQAHARIYVTFRGYR